MSEYRGKKDKDEFEDACERCRGTGENPDVMYHQCPDCVGTGLKSICKMNMTVS